MVTLVYSKRVRERSASLLMCFVVYYLRLSAWTHCAGFLALLYGACVLLCRLGPVLYLSSGQSVSHIAGADCKQGVLGSAVRHVGWYVPTHTIPYRSNCAVVCCSCFYIIFALCVCVARFSPLLCLLHLAGITLYRLLTGEMPFHSSNMQDFFSQVTAAKFVVPPHVSLSPGALDLLRRLLAPVPENRPLPDEVIAHPWMNGETLAPPLLILWVRLRAVVGRVM